MVDEPPPRAPRLALVIGDPGMRSRLTTALVLKGVDVLIASSFDAVREGTPVVTDRPPEGNPDGNAAEQDRLYAVALARDRSGSVRIVAQVTIAQTDPCAVVRAANDVLAGRDPRLG